MEDMSHSESDGHSPVFVNYGGSGAQDDSFAAKDLIRTLAEASLIPWYPAPSGAKRLLKEDLQDYLEAISQVQRTGLFGDDEVASIGLADGTTIDFERPTSELPPEVFAGIRNLTRVSRETETGGGIVRRRYYDCSAIRPGTAQVSRQIDAQQSRHRRISDARQSQFANSAYYLGSKRDLRGFLVEALSGYMTESSKTLDLMCGSGAASGAFADFWPTYASDAHTFCQLLAKIQGGGYSQARARSVLDRVLPRARDHAEELTGLVESFVENEDDLFHGVRGSETVAEYRELISQFPNYDDGRAHGSWRPDELVRARQDNPKLQPYCLITAYFGNIYFGLRQSIEIDSLRYAIDQLGSQEERVWCLGSLLVAMSGLSTSYGGHFAQPLVTSANTSAGIEWQRIIERRSHSMFQEFSVRLLRLAEASERIRFDVHCVSGPWKKAIETLRRKNVGDASHMMVYLDPPYTREEYGRYYHVLETVVEYNYPSVTGKGRVPSKKEGERFSSEFFTRSEDRMSRRLAGVVESILANGWDCALSYSTNGIARLDHVVELAVEKCPCSIESYATPHTHRGQGGHDSKEVMEYLVVFRPQ